MTMKYRIGAGGVGTEYYGFVLIRIFGSFRERIIILYSPSPEFGCFVPAKRITSNIT